MRLLALLLTGILITGCVKKITLPEEFTPKVHSFWYVDENGKSHLLTEYNCDLILTEDNSTFLLLVHTDKMREYPP